MLDSIEIKNFKRIGPEGLKLNNLAKVNYLVGKNGSGKSSIIDCIFGYSLPESKTELINLTATSYWGDRNISKVLPHNHTKLVVNNSEMRWSDFKYQNLLTNSVLLVFSSNSSFYYRCDTEKGFYYESFKPKVIDDFDLDERDIEIIKYREIKSRVKDLTYDSMIFDKRYDYKYTNIFNLGYQDITYEGINANYSPRQNKRGALDNTIWDDTLKNEFKDIFDLAKTLNLESRGDGIFDNRKHYQSSGEYILLQFLQMYDLMNKNGQKYLLIEEPESFLHPTFQKLLPLIFGILSKKINVQIILTTHSPFIISAAGEFPDTQKVYMIEDGKCLNPEGSSGNDVKGIAATMLGAGIEDLTPSTVVFCAETEAKFLETINTKFYFKDIKFLTPFNGSDGTIMNLEKLVEAGKFNNTFYKGAEFWYYLDYPNEHQLKSSSYQKLKEKAENQANLILSNKEMFELKFTDDLQQASQWHKNPKDFAETKANDLIKKGKSGKAEFERLFSELRVLFGFKI